MPASEQPPAAHDRWVAQTRAGLAGRLGEDRVAEWESVIGDHRLPDGHLPDYQVLLLMEAAFGQGFVAATRARAAARSARPEPAPAPRPVPVRNLWLPLAEPDPDLLAVVGVLAAEEVRLIQLSAGRRWPPLAGKPAAVILAAVGAMGIYDGEIGTFLDVHAGLAADPRARWAALVLLRLGRLLYPETVAGLLAREHAPA